MDGSSLTDATVASLVSSDGAVSAEAVLLPDGTGYLLAGDLPGLTDEQTYQLCGVTEGGVVSLGLLGAEPGAVVPFQAGEPGDVTALASAQTPVVAGELG